MGHSLSLASDEASAVAPPPVWNTIFMASSPRKSNAKSKRATFHPTDPSHLALATRDGVAVSASEPIALKPRNAAQRIYFKALTDGTAPYVIGAGPAGTGKTHGPVIHAINLLRAKEIKKIIITRPMVGAGGEDLGTLPGGIVEKVSPWCIPILDIIKEHYSAYQVADMLEKEIIEIAPLAIMRGRTLKDAFVIGDEMQNATPAQMKMMLTRLGPNCRMAITGDIEQHDRPDGEYSGLGDLLYRLRDYDGERFSVHQFQKGDVVRHEAIETVIDLYGDAA
jgi:phosphate starvation-inducible PhoH-like protein